MDNKEKLGFYIRGCLQSRGVLVIGINGISLGQDGGRITERECHNVC